MPPLSSPSVDVIAWVVWAKETTAWLIHVAYRQYGYPLAEIADHMGVHAAMVSRRLKQAEQSNI
jgi:DNA-binding transcriptional regulator LsrR (DeoR family)